MMSDNPSFLAIGECMVELSPVGKSTYGMGFAGDTFNTAWYIRKLLGKNWQVSYLSALGDDPISDGMVSFIQDANISVDHIVRISGNLPGLYMIKLAQGERSFFYWRQASAARELANDLAHLTRAMQGGGVIYFSGITVAILPDKGRQNLFTALANARKSGSKIVFDPNLRPALWANTETMCHTITQAAGLADIVLPSFDDEAQYFGDTNAQDTLGRYLDIGAHLVVVKNGSDEIVARDTSGANARHTPTLVTAPTDTTAAGDSFNAGFLAAWLNGADLSDAVQSGAALSGMVIQKPGALVNI